MKAIVGRDLLHAIYRQATNKPFGYLWVNKAADDDDDIFHPDGLGTPGLKISSLNKNDDTIAEK